MKTVLQLPLSIIIFIFAGYAHTTAQKYYFYVQLTDKNNSPYSLNNPSEYLSARALERRAHFRVPIDSTDLPVNPQYIQDISSKGIHIHSTTKWLNGLMVLLSDSTKIETLHSLPFVDFIQYTGISNENNLPLRKAKNSQTSEYNYGTSATQVRQLNGQVLHQNGYKGEDIHIAVIDAGFSGVNKNPIFDLLYSEGRILGTKDFVNPISDIYAEDPHGAYVLSAMTGETDGAFVGTAPKASYWLLRTEAAVGEYLYEPDLWIAAIEFADSAGVDLATTSLGYTTFDDPRMNYQYSDLDGKTARSSIAANLAYKKGVFIFNAAGNEGNSLWKHISTPADAKGVIAVGSVNKDSIYSAFSSLGPSSDGRIKPELTAIGQSSALVNTSGNTFSANGTSFSTPILAGVAACFLQAVKEKAPQLSMADIHLLIFKSAHLYENPNSKMGYGIPDFQKAYTSLLANSVYPIYFSYLSDNKNLKIMISEKQENILLNLANNQNRHEGKFRLFSLTGELIFQTDFTEKIYWLKTNKLKRGIYVIQIEYKK